MKVKIDAITEKLYSPSEVDELHQPITYEEQIIVCARVSSKRDDKHRDYAKLLSYLIDNKHWSPFEMVGVRFEIHTSRAIAAQILRHRSFSFQEYSQRYAEVTALEPLQLRLQAESNRQSSTEEVNCDDLMREAQIALDTAQAAYDKLIAGGVAKECARMVLPLTTQTTLFMHGTLRSWIHYLDLRADEHTQLEHQQIALEIQRQLATYFPETAKALEWV